jgi:hypothetical protein
VGQEATAQPIDVRPLYPPAGGSPFKSEGILDRKKPLYPCKSLQTANEYAKGIDFDDVIGVMIDLLNPK